MYDKVAISIYPHWPEKKRTYVSNMPIHLLNIFDEIVTMKQPMRWDLRWISLAANTSHKMDEHGPFIDDQMLKSPGVTGRLFEASAQLQPGGPRETRPLLAARRQGKQLGLFFTDQHENDPNIIYILSSIKIYKHILIVFDGDGIPWPGFLMVSWTH